MEFLNPATMHWSANLVIFAVCTAVTWFASYRLSGYGKIISERTRAGQTFVGTVLLGGIVSLPEMAMALTAAVAGNALLAVNTLLGGVAVIMATLAITDAVVGREPLSSDVQHPVVLLQACLVVLLLTIVAAGMTTGDVPLLSAGAWTVTLLVSYLLCLSLVKITQCATPWIVSSKPEWDNNRSNLQTVPARSATDNPVEGGDGDEKSISMPRVTVNTMLAGAAILGAGWVLARTAEVLAVQTGLGASFVGLILGGLATSVPEIGSTISAARLKQHEMAFADAFGTNLFSVMLLFIVDLAYPGRPILNEVGRFALFATLLGIAVTSAYLVGLVARPKLTFFRMGIDSIIVFCLTAIGLLILYQHR